MKNKHAFVALLWLTYCLGVARQIFWSSKASDDDAEHYGVQSKLYSFKTNARSREALTCELDDQGRCCAPWAINMDAWWLHHPDWFVSLETEDQYCFSRIQDEDRAAFFRKVHDSQWNHSNDGSNNSTCDQVVLANQTNAGYAANINQVVYGLQWASDRGLPFQITKHRAQMRWMFATPNESSWAYCESQDMNCYYLPYSDCQPIIGGDSKHVPEKPQTKRANKEFQWLRLYVTRPKQIVRQKVFEFITQVQGLPPLPWNITCTAMHIRRGDSGFVKFPFRRYAAVQEYIDKAKIQPGETIVLLCDDESTIEEVQKYHANTYKWIYLKRQRVRGTDAGFNKHIPSNDEPLEVISIMAETKMAAQCQKLVVGNSGFVTVIKDEMTLANQPYKQVVVQTRVKKDDAKKEKKLDHRVRVENMLKDIEAKYNDMPKDPG